MQQPPFVSILMLTHNAPDLVRITIDTLRAKTDGVTYELVVVDNASDPETVELVKAYEASGDIDTLILSERNTLFAEGNNIAARAATSQATHFCLLNSDIEIRQADWLSTLLARHTSGVTAFGMQQDPLRVDGYCLLIDAPLYRAEELDESHQWWWSVTKLQGNLLTAGHSVQGFFEHETYLHHFGGGSGDAFKSAQGMNVTRDEVHGWFHGHKPRILDPWPFKAKMALTKIQRKLRNAPHRIFRLLKRQ
ncbi:glycosyltransferase [uncultured Roseobacter sp.]|uniref:glycosyltransferase family 2 protein n=1 Tax=uncultured Roseobacter sp. TaxID=114847 RepID=UPI00260642AA|nr:glycosyltransferase [uncultured Roseobacter sp.]